MFTKYGYSTIGIIAFLSFVMICISFYVNNQVAKYFLIIFPLLLMVFTLNFFRDPERVTPKDENLIISPADGKIIVIKAVEENNYLRSRGKQISIFMSPLNVHVNRIPISGEVEYLKYHEGKFIKAFDDKASQENERMEIGIKSNFGKVFFTQVAGFVARRIVTDLNIGDSVIVGNRFGMIKFGSRVDIIAPDNFIVKAKVGDNVTAGETILFEQK
ncbi:MAG TPA: phosphatidylserine decarboxylase family protein [Ignavibacteriaceae bacterium]|nr:phosphatidylserine decarboxylase family protein [Ignavibacteriaceae bacterium]